MSCKLSKRKDVLMAEQAAPSLEGWFCLHLFWKINWTKWRRVPQGERRECLDEFKALAAKLDAIQSKGEGSHYWCQVNGQKADLGLMVLRETLDQLQEVETDLEKLHLSDYLEPTISYVSVTEVGLYSGKPTTDRGWSYVKASLHPKTPDKPYLCFYPMSKTRVPGANWYTLPYDQRKAYMHDHGKIGRSYAGKVSIILTGSIGLDDYEWGVTLFADDPVQFKKIVTEMRYIEASSIYGEFPYFLVGTKTDPERIDRLLTDQMGQ